MLIEKRVYIDSETGICQNANIWSKATKKALTFYAAYAGS